MIVKAGLGSVWAVPTRRILPFDCSTTLPPESALLPMSAIAIAFVPKVGSSVPDPASTPVVVSSMTMVHNANKLRRSFLWNNMAFTVFSLLKHPKTFHLNCTTLNHSFQSHFLYLTTCNASVTNNFEAHICH